MSQILKMPADFFICGHLRVISRIKNKPLNLRQYLKLLKRKFYISFIALVELTMLALTVVPHHHHEGIACVIMNHCEESIPVDDEDSDHAEHDMNHDACVIEAAYIVPRINDEIKCKVSSCDNSDHIHFFPVLYLVADFLPHFWEPVNLSPEFREHIPLYISLKASRQHGLRAPPCCS